MNNGRKTLHVSILILAVFSLVSLRPAPALCSGPYIGVDGDTMLVGGAMVFVGIPAAVGAVIAMAKNLNAVRTRDRSKAAAVLGLVTSAVCISAGALAVAVGQQDGYEDSVTGMGATLIGIGLLDAAMVAVAAGSTERKRKVALSPTFIPDAHGKVVTGLGISGRF